MSLKRKKMLLKCSKVELIKQCKSCSLSATGSKSDMIDRILKHENGSDPEDEKKVKPKKRRDPAKLKKPKKKKDAILSRNAFHFVLSGYIRTIEKMLTSNQIIPRDIYFLCFHYLLPNNIFITLSTVRKEVDSGYGSKTKTNDEIIDIQMWTLDANMFKSDNKNIDNTVWQNKQTEIVPLDKSVAPRGVYREKIAVCAGLNVTLPPKINGLLHSKHPNYDMIFRSGGGGRYGASCSNECAAFIINDNHKTGSKIHNLPLPELPKFVKYHSMTFSNKYGLFCIGGAIQKSVNGQYQQKWSKAVHTLPFHGDIYKKQDLKSSYLRRQWKWNKITSMNEARLAPQTIMIGVDKLMVIGGRAKDNSNENFIPWRYNNWWYRNRNNYNHNQAHMKSVEMLDLRDDEKSKWETLSELNTGRYNAGICYESIGNSLYMAGGDGAASQRIEKYDFEKNKWLHMGKTMYGYYVKPMVWIDDMDPNILNIASARLDYHMERIDLRMEINHSDSKRQRYDTVDKICLRLY